MIPLSYRTYMGALIFALLWLSIAGAVRHYLGELAVLAGHGILMLLVVCRIGDPALVNAPQKTPVMNHSLNLSIIAIGALWLIGLAQIFNPNVIAPEIAVRYFRISAYPLVFVLIGVQLARHANAARLLVFIALPAFAILNIAFAFSQYLAPGELGLALLRNMDWQTTGTLGSFRLTGLYIDTMPLSIAAGLTFVTGLLLWLTRTDGAQGTRLPRFLPPAYSVIGLMGLGISLSRTAMVISGMIAVLMVAGLGWRRPMRLISVIALALATVFASAGYLKASDPLAYDYALARYKNIISPTADRSFSVGRLERWSKDVLPAIGENPLGTGLGSSGSRRDWQNTGYRERPIIAESAYFGVTLELGWVAGLIFAGLVVAGLVRSVLVILSGGKEPQYSVAAAAFIFFGIASTTVPALAASPTSYVAWMMFGMLMSLQRSKR